MDDMLGFLYENYPVEMIQHEKEVERTKAQSINAYHANLKKDARIMGSPPERFYGMIIKFTDIFKEMPYKSEHDFWVAFFKRYKQFSYAEKI